MQFFFSGVLVKLLYIIFIFFIYTGIFSLSLYVSSFSSSRPLFSYFVSLFSISITVSMPLSSFFISSFLFYLYLYLYIPSLLLSSLSLQNILPSLLSIYILNMYLYLSIRGFSYPYTVYLSLCFSPYLIRNLLVHNKHLSANLANLTILPNSNLCPS